MYRNKAYLVMSYVFVGDNVSYFSCDQNPRIQYCYRLKHNHGGKVQRVHIIVLKISVRVVLFNFCDLNHQRFPGSNIFKTKYQL